MNIIGALGFILDTFFTLIIVAVLLRVIFQYVGAPFSNPICQFIVNITNFGFKPLRRIIPGFKGIDFAGIVFAYILACLNVVCFTFLSYQFLPSISSILISSIYILLSTSLTIAFWAIILRVIISFVAALSHGYNPFFNLVVVVSEPILAPIRRLIPPVGGFDLSPLFACFLISFIRVLFKI